ncbi:hypothetical protein NEOKW01_1429 [Nematocida sp. AWRm80]|nr:hypothetical protein NEOKW01_1429 [Nematocida sp. AWRm80]
MMLNQQNPVHFSEIIISSELEQLIIVKYTLDMVFRCILHPDFSNYVLKAIDSLFIYMINGIALTLYKDLDCPRNVSYDTYLKTFKDITWLTAEEYLYLSQKVSNTNIPYLMKYYDMRLIEYHTNNLGDADKEYPQIASISPIAECFILLRDQIQHTLDLLTNAYAYQDEIHPILSCSRRKLDSIHAILNAKYGNYNATRVSKSMAQVIGV